MEIHVHMLLYLFICFYMWVQNFVLAIYALKTRMRVVVLEEYGYVHALVQIKSHVEHLMLTKSGGQVLSFTIAHIIGSKGTWYGGD